MNEVLLLQLRIIILDKELITTTKDKIIIPNKIIPSVDRILAEGKELRLTQSEIMLIAEDLNLQSIQQVKANFNRTHKTKAV